MTTLDLSPLYRSSVGFDRMGALLDTALRADKSTVGYPPYDIEVVAENQYAVTIAVAGFEAGEIDIQAENGVLSVRGKKTDDKQERSYLYRGIANRAFERKFNLADHIEVTGADLANGLLTISLVKEIPEAMKPKTIAINSPAKKVEHQAEAEEAA